MKVHTLLFAAVLATSAANAAESGCGAFKWDVSSVVKLYSTAPTAISASSDVAGAPVIEAGRLYALDLRPQSSVNYAVPPSKKMLADGAWGGILSLNVPVAGQYRIAIDSGYWLDVIHDGKPLATVDFNGSPTCEGPRKIVVFDLPANTPLLLQTSAATGAKARLTVTPVAHAH